MKIIGIYKITNPKGKIYVGQSIDCIDRWEIYYKKLNCKNQRKLYLSLKKYGWENHKFEIIEECDLELLNKQERYWQEYYNVIGKNGLNCRLTETNDKSGKDSNETRYKKSKSLCKPILQYDLNGNFIKEWSSIKEVEEKLNLSKVSGVCRGTNISSGGFLFRFKSNPLEKNYQPKKHGNTDKIRSEETKQKMSISGKGVPQPIYFSKLKSKPILQYDKQDNFIQEWNSIIQASNTLNIDFSAISKCCRGIYKSTKNYKFKFKNNES